MIEKVKSIIASVMEVPVDSLSLTSSSEEISTWDSLRHMNLVVALEETFQITFTEQEIANLSSVQSIDSILKGKTA